MLSPSLLDHGRMGLITLDSNRRVDDCLGTLVSWMPLGCHAGEAIPLLIGLDSILDEIANGQRSSFSLPRASLQKGALADKVVSLEIMSAEEPGGLQILVRDETELADLEQNIHQQRNELFLANEALSEAKDRTEAALREKSSFLAKISHDLKTPLQVIMGNAEILRGDLPRGEREEFLQDVLDNSNFLLALITDLLEASALEVDQMKLTEEVIDVGALLRRMLSMVRQLPGGNERHFELSVDDGHKILADPMRFQRLLVNVVGNAVKFTEDGGRIALKAGPIDTGEFIIEIEDDGCGVDPEMMKRVFEPFVTGSVTEGSGLGLHIAKGLADLHQADLTLMSEPGSGTTISLRLPRSRVVNTPT